MRKPKSPYTEFPGKTATALEILRSLQTLFNVNELLNHHILCLSTKNYLFELTVKCGDITFYEKNGSEKEVNLTGENATSILQKFCKELKHVDYCKIHVIENEPGNNSQTDLDFIIRYQNEFIVRTNWTMN